MRVHTVSPPQVQETLPIFVYGTLRRGDTAGELIGEHVQRCVRATATGRSVVANRSFPTVLFRPDGEDIRGELLWIRVDVYAAVLEQLDQYEAVPDLFVRKRVRVRTEEGAYDAWAYEWAETQEVVDEYLYAVERKMQVAHYHLSRLRAVPEQEFAVGEQVTIPVQAHFEALLASAVTISDQLAEVLNLGCDLGLVTPNLQRALQALDRRTLRTRLMRWHDRPIAADYREVRRLVTHHWSVKTPKGTEIHVQRVSRGRYNGPRDLLSYSAAVVDHLADLEPILDDVRAALAHHRVAQ